MRLLKYFLIGFFAAISIGFCTAQAYTTGEIPGDSETFTTLENQNIIYGEANLVQVSMFADFSDYVEGELLFAIWDREDLTKAEQRLGMEFPEVSQLEKYVQFGIRQNDKLRSIDTEPDSVISWGWKYARYPKATDAVCTTVDYFQETGTTKAQLLGVIKQFDNLVSNGGDAGKVLRSVADLYGKVDEVKNELSVMRIIVDATE